MRIVIGNLPDTVTEEEIREVLSAFAPAEKIKLVKEGSAPSVIIEMEMTRAGADALAKRIQGKRYEGKELSAWVPTMGW